MPAGGAQHPVGRQPDCVADALVFEVLINLGVGERRVAPEIPLSPDRSIETNPKRPFYTVRKTIVQGLLTLIT